MAYTNHFWKKIQQQSKKSTLSEMYRMVVENENVALYSKDIGDSTVIPPAPEGIDKVTVVSKDYLPKIKSLSKFQNTQQEGIVVKILKDKAHISAKYHNVLIPVIKNAVELSGYEHVKELFEYSLQLGGLFDILKENNYNVISAVVESLNQFLKNQEKLNIVDSGLQPFLLTLLSDRTQFASTQTGPGELYLVLFSNATTAGASSGGQKSGDLEVDGQKIELKSSGARMGGGSSTFVGQSNANISKYLKSKNRNYADSDFFEKEKAELCDRLSDLVVQNKNVQNFLSTSKQMVETDEIHSMVIKGFESGIFNPLAKILASSPNATWEMLVTGTGTLAKKTGKPLNYFILNKLREIKNEHINEQPTNIFDEVPTKDQANLVYLLANTFNILKRHPEVANQVTKEDLIQVIYYTNSYSEEECSGFDYSIINDLTHYFSSYTTEQILNLSSGRLLNLIGAMHLVSYTQEQKFNKLMFLEKTTGKVAIFDAPMTVEDGLNVCKRTDITVDPRVDSDYGVSCKYYYKPS